MAVILIKKYKVQVDGKTLTGPLMAGPAGMAVGEKTGRRWKGLKPIDTFEQRHWIVRWDDVTGYEITQPQPSQFAGSTINNYEVMLTLKTAANQHSFRLKYNDPERLCNQIGPLLAMVDARQAGQAA